MKSSWLAKICVVAALCVPTIASANNPDQGAGGASASHAHGSGRNWSGVSTVCAHCPAPLHSGKSHRPPPGTGGYESAGYGDDGGGIRVKPNGGVQHTPPLEPVTSTVQTATQVGAP